MSNSLCSFWGHSVHFAKFAVLRFSKGYFLPQFLSNFNQTLCKVCQSVGIQAVTLFGDVSNLKNLRLFKDERTSATMTLTIEIS